uniref:Ribosomal protein S3 n=1 Tax=Bacidia sp. TaxID=2040699 RepID=A0A482JZC7_9LECA|nr:ribosomal protein S3 [Bacidia sp.]
MTNLNKLDKNKQNIINNDKILVTNKLANIKQKQLKLGSKTLAETSYAHKIKHYPVASKEWSNSVYTYEKNSHKTTTLQDKTLVKLIKAYFNSYSRKLEKNLKRIKSRMLRSKKRKTSLNGILSSKAEIKHSNDKAIITIYVYNSQKKYYFNKLKKKENFIKHRLGLKRPNTWTENKVAQFLNPKINRRINSILNKNLSNYNYTSLAANFVNSLFSIEKKKIRNVTRHFYKMFNKGRYLLEFPKKFRAINKKFKSNKKIKSKKKNIKFKAISKIESKNLLKDFLKSKSKKNIKSKDVLDRSLSQLTNNETKDLNINKDFVFSSASSEAKGNISNKVNTINSYKLMKVIKSIKHKSLNGVTIQLSGRLSKYNTASRSMSSLKYKGNVRNLDSSDKGLSTVSLRGYDKSNLQHSKFNSKVRTGSFGLKGWISSK